MSIAEVEEHRGVSVIKIFGSLTIKVIEDFDDICETEIKKRPDVIGLDCRDLDFIDSVGINHLFKLSHSTMSGGIKLVLFDLNPTILEIFRVTNLYKLLKVVSRETFELEYLVE